MNALNKQFVRGILCGVAARAALVTYGEMLSIAGYKPGDPKAMHDLLDLLGKISEDEARKGRPLLSIIVVNQKTGWCGPGFFKMAERAGVKLPTQTNAEFFIQELRRTHKFWAK